VARFVVRTPGSERAGGRKVGTNGALVTIAEQQKAARPHAGACAEGFSLGAIRDRMRHRGC
jgi:hypothetical protein